MRILAHLEGSYESVRNPTPDTDFEDYSDFNRYAVLGPRAAAEIGIALRVRQNF